MIINVLITIFVVVWVWIISEIMNAPEYDEDENPIEK
jgi:hypothetical protein